MAAAGAFVAAALLALFATPRVRQLALTAGFTDEPAERKSHTAPVPYLGGIPIMAGALVGLALGGGVTVKMGVAALAGAALGSVGLIDDDKTLEPTVRRAAQVAAALAVEAVGVRAHVTGVLVVDVLLTVVWIVGITNAVNFLDNMDGLAGGVSAAAAAAVFILSSTAGQDDVARLAAGVAGACVGFLVYNKRPASIFMGDAGALFLGFLLSVIVLEVDPALASPATFLVPLLLLGLPVLDTATVTLARLRRGRPVDAGGKDHLSHRLVARGLSPGVAVAVLVYAEVLLAALAVLAGRASLPLPIAAAAAALLAIIITTATAPARVYDEEIIGFPRALRVAVFGTAVVAVLAVVPTGLAMFAARRPAQAGADLARTGLAAAQAGDQVRAASAFSDAERALATADARLHAPLSSLGLLMPVVNSNLRAARTVVEVGRDLSRSGAELAETYDPSRLRVAGGEVNLPEVRRVAPKLVDAAERITDGYHRIQRARAPYLVRPLEEAVADFDGRLAKASATSTRAADAATLAPAILGGSGTRHYFLAIQNNSELRPAGGFVGNYGELTATKGKLHLSRFGRIDDLRFSTPVEDRRVTLPAPKARYKDLLPLIRNWGGTNISPDFPTSARVMAELYPQSTGRRVDGVIAVDPYGLAALMEITGPVTVAGWPEPLTAANVADVSLRDQYIRFPKAQGREEFLGQVARTTWETFTTGEVGEPTRLASALGKAARERHIQVFLARKGEQRLVTDLQISGRIAPLRSDSLLVTNNNAGGNKTDLFLHRRFRYALRLEPHDEFAQVRGELGMTLENQAPTKGWPNSVIGPFGNGQIAGENDSLVSVYTPLALRSASLDRKPLKLQTARELGRNSYWGFLRMPSKTSARFALKLDGTVALEPGGWYTLDVAHQPTVNPDELEVSVEVPSGWRVAEARGLRVTGPRSAAAELRLTGDAVLRVRLERVGAGGFWHRLAP